MGNKFGNIWKSFDKGHKKKTTYTVVNVLATSLGAIVDENGRTDDCATG